MADTAVVAMAEIDLKFGVTNDGSGERIAITSKSDRLGLLRGLRDGAQVLSRFSSEVNEGNEKRDRLIHLLRRQSSPRGALVHTA